MGTRIIWLLPNANGGILAVRKSNPSIGIAANVTPSGPLFNAWRDGAWDDITEGGQTPCGTGSVCSFGYYAPHMIGGADARLWVNFDDPPTLVQFNRVTLVCYWDYSARPTNPYIFPQGVPDGYPAGPMPPTNTHGPRSRIMIRNRANTDWLYDPTWWNAGFSNASGTYGIATGSPVTGHHYCNINRPDCASRPATYGSYDGPLKMSWNLTAHPEGGVFSFEDIRTIQAGVHSQCDTPAWDQYGGVAFVQVRFFHFYIELEVSDPGGYVTNLRHVASHELRLSRRPRNSITLSLPAPKAAGRELGDVAFLSHPRGLDARGEGWPERRILRRPAQILQRTYWPETLRVIDQHQDLHDFRCNAWAAFRIGIPWAAELSGMAYLDQAGGFVHARLQDSWSPRPGDRVLVRVIEKPTAGIERPNLSTDGLSCTGAADVELCRQNVNPLVSPWTVLGGPFTGVADDTGQIAEEFGYTTSVRVNYASGQSGGYRQSLGTLTGAAVPARLLHLVARVRNVVVSNPLVDFAEFTLTRGTGGGEEWFNFSTRLWQVTPYHLPLPSTGPVGEVTFDGIPNDVTKEHFANIGRFSSGMPNAAEFVFSLTSVQRGGSAFGSSYGARMPLATVGSTIVRAGEQWTMDNTGAFQFWFADRGAALFEWRPMFRALSMPAVEIKPIARQEGASNLGRDQVFFESGASVDVIRFRRTKADNATSYTVTTEIRDAAGAVLRLTRDHVVRVFVQWNGAEGAHQEAPYQLRLGVAIFLEADGSFVSWNESTATGAAIDWLPGIFYLGCDNVPRYLDGWMRTFEVKRNPLFSIEAAWRR